MNQITGIVNEKGNREKVTLTKCLAPEHALFFPLDDATRKMS
jgi:hypothetical protein